MAKEDEWDDDVSWVVATKFTPNRPNIKMVHRARLLERLTDGLSAKAIVLIAPAGFGKSTLLSQWAETSLQGDDIFSWLSLDEADSAPEQFLAYITLALISAGVELEQFGAAARNGFPDSRPGVVLSSLMRRVSNLPYRCVLILDDLHHVSSPETDALFNQMIREAPTNLTLVLNSRTPPPLDLPSLVAAGDVVEIKAEQLLLTQEESKQALGIQIEDAAALEIFKLTEGWPVAVQLARAQKQAKPNASFKAGVSSGLIASYLTLQVLNTLAPDVREFLLDISVLEQFNASLADAVRGTNNSAAMLKELEAFEALLVPTDTRTQWMRLHHLIAEYLRETLFAEAPARANEIYRAATRWFEAGGQLIPAVRYARLTNDDALIERLILDAGGWSIILTEGINVMRTLLRLAPEHLISSSARLMVAKAYLCCKDGKYQEARGLLDASETLKPKENCEDYDRDQRLVGSMIGAYEDTRNWTIESAARDMPSELDHWTPLEAGTLLCEAVIALLSCGDLKRAHDYLELAFREMRRSRSVLGLNYSYIHAATHALYCGKFDLAKANIAQALELAENNFGSDSGLKHISLILDFAIRTWSGEIEREDIDAFSAVFSHIEHNDGWAEIYLIGLDAGFAACEQHKDLAAATQFYERMLRLAERRNLARLDRLARIMRLRAAYLSGQSQDVAKAAKGLSKWLSGRNLATSPRDWQNHFLAVCNLGMSRMISPSVAVDTARSCSAYSQSIGAHFFEIRLLVTEAVLLWQQDKQARSVSTLKSALELAAPQKIIGPFIGHEALKPILSQVSAALSLDQESILLVNFISQISKRRRDLRPKTANDLLSGREQEIIEQLAQGHSNKEIARRFELTENTVKFHLKNIYGKLDVNRRTQAIAKARDLSIIQ